MQNMDNVCEPTTLQTEQGSKLGAVECAQEEKGLADLGKFKDVNALLRAYESLQAEFTRRSQRLKRYEQELENQVSFSDGQKAASPETCQSVQTEHDVDCQEIDDRTVEADAPETGSVRPDSANGECVEMVAARDLDASGGSMVNGMNNMATHDGKDVMQVGVGNENNTPSLYEQVMANEDVRLKIIGDYLSSIGKSGAPLVKGGAGVLTAPTKKAGSISEAGKMALAYLKTQKKVN